jgi:hypothetical protein
MVIVRTAAMPVTIALSGCVGSVGVMSVEVEDIEKIHARSTPTYRKVKISRRPKRTF